MSELYEAYNRLLNQEPRFTIIIEYVPGSKVALTSHPDAAVPDGVPAIHNVVVEKTVRSVTQKIDPLKGVASVGNISLQVLNNPLGGVKTSNVPYLELQGIPKPTAVLARTASANPTLHTTADRIAELGFSVYTAEVNTISVAACAAYDVVIVDTVHLGADEHSVFIQDCYNAGYNVLVTGDDSSSNLFYIDAVVIETTKFRLEPHGNHQVETDVEFKWSSIDGSHAHITEWAAGVIPTVSFIGGGDCAAVTWDNVTGAKLYHDQVGANTGESVFPEELKNYLKNVMYWLGGQAIHYSSYSLNTVFYDYLSNGSSLKNRDVSIYRGMVGLGWDNYKQLQTQQVESVSFDGGVYTISCYDIQRITKSKIFSEQKAYLTASIGPTDVYIPVSSYDDYTAIEHGPSFSDAPDATVGYVRLNKEVVRWASKYAHPTLGPTLVVDTARPRGRGALGTAPAEHNISSATNELQNTKVKEFIYLEMPLVKIAHAILTGTPYGSVTPWPSHWTLGIDARYISTAQFIEIGKDWWDPDDDTAGRIGRVTDPGEVEGKKFIESEILSLLGGFMPVLPDGALGLRRVDRCLVDNPYSELIDSSQFISRSPLKYDTTQVANQFSIRWNYDFIQEETTRENVLFDANSISVNKGTYDKTFSFKALHGNRHTLNSLQEQFSTLMDRYSYPPYTMTITVPISVITPYVGQVLRVQDDTLEDLVSGGGFDRSMEVQRVATDFGAGTHKMTLFGSTQTTAAQALSTTDVLTATFYATGNDISLMAGVTNISGVYHVTQNLDLSASYGALDFNSAAAIIRCPGPLEIDSGVTVTTKLNTQFRVNGHLQINGTVTSKGRGTTGATALLKCFKIYPTENCWFNTFEYPPTVAALTFGSTVSQGGVVIGDSSAVYRGARYNGTWGSLPVYTVDNPNGNVLYGLPTSALGVAGCSGGHSAINGGSSADSFTSGGDGGGGGGGLMFISKGLDIGAGGLVDTSGDNGQIGSSVYYSQAGGGAGGMPGGVIIFLDGNTPYPTGLARVRAVRGYSPYAGTSISHPQDHPGRLVCSAYEPDALVAKSYSDSMVRVQYLPPSVVPIADATTYSDPVTGLSVVEYLNTPQTINQNLLTLEVNWTPPSGDETYLYADVYIKLATDTVWTFVDSAYNSASTVLASDGTTYDVKVVSVNNYYVQSPEYVETSTTVSNDTSFVSLGTSNYLAAFKTTFTDTTSGFWLGVDGDNWAKLNIGDSVDNLKWDGTNLSITGNISATSGTIGSWVIETDRLKSSDGIINLIPNSGIYVKHATLTSQVSITPSAFSLYDATIGANLFSFDLSGTATMAGWTLDNTAFTSPNGRVVLDATNNQLIAYGVNPANYVRMTGTELRGVDSVLGTTFLLPTDGSPPQFSSGVITSTEYQLYTSSVIKTAADPSTTGGVLMNDTGVHVYNSLGTRTAFLDAINSNHEFTGQITLTGGDFFTSAENVLYDPLFIKKVHDGIDYWPDHAQAVYSATSGENSTSGVTITANGTIIDLQADKYIPAKVGDVFHVKATVYESVGLNGSYGFIIQTYDGQKVNLLDWPNYLVTAGTSQGVWKVIEGTITVEHSNAEYVQIALTLRQYSTTGSIVYSSAYASHVQDGADVTLTAINGGLVVTAGYLTGGTNTVLLDYANKRVTVGSETYGSDGIQLEYNSGNPRMYVGNGGNKYIEFDGTDVVVGRDTEIHGVDSYNNLTFYQNVILGANLLLANGTTSGLTLTTDIGRNTISASASTSFYGDYIIGSTYPIDDHPALNVKSRFKTKVANFAPAGSTDWSKISIYLVRGKINSSGATYTNTIGYGFYFNVGTMYGIWGDSSTNTVNLGITYSSLTSTVYKLEAIFVPGTSISFYVDDVLKATVTTNVPNSASIYYDMNLFLTSSGNVLSNNYSYSMSEYRLNAGYP